MENVPKAIFNLTHNIFINVKIMLIYASLITLQQSTAFSTASRSEKSTVPASHGQVEITNNL